MLVLDTDVIIDIQRGLECAVDWFRGLNELPLLPGFVLMELIQDAPDKKHVEAVQRLVKPLPIVWPTESECAKALSDFVQYHLSHGLGLLDALIGASASGRGAELCTFNVKHYRMIPDLTTIPYSRPSGNSDSK